jgi:signal transduction histidine kinase
VDRTQIGLALPVEGSLTGRVLLTGEPQRLSDGTPGGAVPLPPAYGARTALVVPLVFRGEGLGVLAALDRGDAAEEFSADDERLMSAFATSAATAVATARDVAAQALRRSLEAAERERSHWARELHDQTLQDLAALRVMVGSARRKASREEVDATLELVTDQLQHSISSLRGLITELRPAALDELGLAPALATLAERQQAISGLEIELDVPEFRHTPELENTVYRVVQEALSNAIKHAGATRASVRVAEEYGNVVATVNDDGSGFDVAAASQGFGLVGMRERVALLGGELDVRSSPGRGARITTRLPVERG